MSVYDEVEMQVAKTVQNVPILHGHGYEVDDALLQTVPHVNQTLFQIVNVSHLRPINTVLHRTPHAVNRDEVGAVRRSQIVSNES